jgi:predicted PurR-regulated permease PerM
VQLAALGITPVDLAGALQRLINAQVGNVVGYVSGLLALLGNVVLVPLVMFFLLKDGRTFKKSFISAVPNRYLELTVNVLHKMDLQLGAYLRGKLLLSMFVGLLSILALWMLGVDYFVVLGALNGLANLIPYLGPLLGGLTTVVVAVFTTGTFDAVPGIVVAFTIIQAIDNAVFQPLILARNVHLHPLTIILAIIIGGQFFGVLGLFLAVPAAGIVKVVLQEILRNLRQFHLA